METRMKMTKTVFPARQFRVRGVIEPSALQEPLELFARVYFFMDLCQFMWARSSFATI